SLHLSVGHVPTLSTGLVIRAAGSPPRVGLRKYSKPVAQRLVGICQGVTFQGSAPGGAREPGRAARHALTDLQCANQVRDCGATPAAGLEVSLSQLLQRSLL